MLRLKKLIAVFAALALLGGLVVIAMAINTATQDVTVAVAVIDSISTTGTVGTLSISVFDTDVTNTSTTMDYNTNVAAPATRKITAQLNSDYSSGITLKVAISVEASKGTSAGSVLLSSAAAADVVTAIPACSSIGRTITYTAKATAGTGQVSEQKTVTFTITG